MVVLNRGVVQIFTVESKLTVVTLEMFTINISPVSHCFSNVFLQNFVSPSQDRGSDSMIYVVLYTETYLVV